MINLSFNKSVKFKELTFSRFLCTKNWRISICFKWFTSQSEWTSSFIHWKWLKIRLLQFKVCWVILIQKHTYFTAYFYSAIFLSLADPNKSSFGVLWSFKSDCWKLIFTHQFSYSFCISIKNKNIWWCNIRYQLPYSPPSFCILISCLILTSIFFFLHQLDTTCFIFQKGKKKKMASNIKTWISGFSTIATVFKIG